MLAFAVTEGYPMPTQPSTHLGLDPEIESRLLQLAESRPQPADTLMRQAVEQYVEREERREQLRQDALVAWAEYQATGQHVTGDEADVWLSRLEAGEDVEPPAPHT
jgi:predicted transcriptional regulator